MTDGSKRKTIPATRAMLIAAVAGALAGAVAVYVSGGLSGNNAPVPADAIATDAAAETACAAKADLAKRVAADAKGEVAAMLPADPPQSLSTLAYSSPDEAPMTLASLRGKTVLLNLWATWCAPCRAEMPELDKLEKQSGGEGFEVVAVNVDTGDFSKPQKFLAETGVTSLKPYRENSLRLFNELKGRGLALGLPVTLLIDAEGCLLASMNGPANWGGDDGRRLVTAASMGG